MVTVLMSSCASLQCALEEEPNPETANAFSAACSIAICFSGYLAASSGLELIAKGYFSKAARPHFF